MAVEVSRREIEQEADDSIALGRLLRIQRDEPKRKAVERILATDLSVARKIEKIREIDRVQEAEEIERIVRHACLQAVRRQFVSVRNSIKAPQKSHSYLTYLLPRNVLR